VPQPAPTDVSAKTKEKKGLFGSIKGFFGGMFHRKT
jgi:hypothetical protein